MPVYVSERKLSFKYKKDVFTGVNIAASWYDALTFLALQSCIIYTLFGSIVALNKHLTNLIT